jgi:hypothetical protein
MEAHLNNHHRDTGFAPDGAGATPDERTRDHGDGRWGEPSE